MSGSEKQTDTEGKKWTEGGITSLVLGLFVGLILDAGNSAAAGIGSIFGYVADGLGIAIGGTVETFTPLGADFVDLLRGGNDVIQTIVDAAGPLGPLVGFLLYSMLLYGLFLTGKTTVQLVDPR